MTHRKFDLEAAKRGEKIQTISGEPLRFLLHDPLLVDSVRVVAASENGHVFTYYENGQYLSRPSRDDICMATRKRQMWARAFRVTAPWAEHCDVDLYRAAEQDDAVISGSNANGEWLGPAVLVAEWEE